MENRSVLYSLLVVMMAASATGCTCSPDSWEGRQSMNLLVDVNGTTIMAGIDVGVSHDAANQHERYDVIQTGTDGNVTRYVLIAQYKKNAAYIYKEDGKCLKIPSGSFEKHCVPDNATVTGPSFTLGGGDNKVLVNTAAYKLADSSVRALVYTADDCYPVMQTRMKQIDGILAMTTILFSNITEGIKDEDIFKLPSSCKGQNVIDATGTSKEDEAIINVVRTYY